MRIAICFWGLCRSTEQTIESIERCVFNPLKNMGANVDVQIHTQTLNHPYTNLRAKEFNCQLNNDAQKLLRPFKSMIENQDEVDKKLNFPKYRAMPNPWPEDGKNDQSTLDNHIRALQSLKQVTSLWKISTVSYDYILQCRPDVRFHTPFQIEWFTNLNPKSILVANFDLIDGINDRFAAGRPSEMEIWGSRFDNAYEYSLRNSLHSEKYLAYVIRKENIKVILIPFLFSRLRANGILCLVNALQ